MNCGTVGFLMNRFAEDDLPARLAAAQEVELHPLAMEARAVGGRKVRAYAFNEVALLRETRQAAKITIDVVGKTRLEELICDGVLVATPAGSPASTMSDHGTLPTMGPGSPPASPRGRRWSFIRWRWRPARSAAARCAPMPSTRWRCCAKPARRRRSPSTSMARRGWRS